MQQIAQASSERRLELSRAANRLAHVVLVDSCPSCILQNLVDIVGPALDLDRALIYDVRFPEEIAVGLCEWLHPERSVPSTRGVFPLGPFASAARWVFDSGEPLESSRTDPHPLLVKDGVADLVHVQRSIQRLLWYPFQLRADAFYVLVLNKDDSPWSPEEMEFVETVSSYVHLALMKLDLLRERDEAQLRDSESRFRLFYDHTPSMFFTVDRSGVVTSVNRFALEHLGYTESVLVGKSVLTVVHPDDCADVTRHLDACFADPGAVRTISFRKVCSDGRTIWVKEATRVVEHGEDEDASALIVCEDVTEARAHQEAARQAEIRSHDKDEFMAMLGHELRNPLSPIVTALEIMRAGGRTDRELEIIDRQVAHLRRLVDDLLDISRITRGKVELHKERVEFAVIAAQASEIALPLFQAKRQVLDIDIPARGLEVYADPSRLVQAFANLLNNAAKYSEEGKEILFQAERHGDRIVVRVRDHGEGIAPEMLERVFDLFVQRAQPADRAKSGLGLGLTIVRNLISLHGGTVRAESGGRGTGALIVVELPPAGGSTERPESESQVEGNEQQRVPERAGSILVVDDNDDVRDSLSRLLTMGGYRVASAADGPSALRIAEEVQPRIVLVDIGLPGMDGYELARRLRRVIPQARLVAITGYGQPSDLARSQEAGFDAHLVKPFGFDALRRYLDDG